MQIWNKLQVTLTCYRYRRCVVFEKEKVNKIEG